MPWGFTGAMGRGVWAPATKTSSAAMQAARAHVGQAGRLRPRRSAGQAGTASGLGPVNDRPQVANLPHMAASRSQIFLLAACEEQDGW
jgi:hypothetical protein